MDNLLIFFPDEETHHKCTKCVLQRMTKLDLHLKLEKCCFATTDVEYLRMIIKPGQLPMDPIKLDGTPAGRLLSRSRTLDPFLALQTSTVTLSLTTPMSPNPLLTSPRKASLGTGPLLAKPHPTLLSPFSCQGPSSTSLTWPPPSPSQLTPPQTPLAPSSFKLTQTATGTPAPISPNHSLQWNETTTSITGNSSPSSVP